MVVEEMTGPAKSYRVTEIVRQMCLMLLMLHTFLSLSIEGSNGPGREWVSRI